MWTKRANKLLQSGDIWTSRDKNPGPEDIKNIAEMVGEGEFSVLRAGKTIRTYRTDGVDIEFVRCEELDVPEDAPSFCPDKSASFLEVARTMGEFSPSEMAEKLYGYVSDYTIFLVNNYLKVAKKEGWVDHLEHGLWEAR